MLNGELFNPIQSLSHFGMTRDYLSPNCGSPPFELIFLALCKYTGSSGSESTALKHGSFLG